ncbi:cation:dicarboxylase symporter family transporter [bacterium 3DAC]|nr:dicarboxylate/amino acid:cation symporter [Dictyoglomota bacterium]UZN22341.1 cation:dicarboxylase symporter family transporter [bacterium 3DAC]
MAQKKGSSQKLLVWILVGFALGIVGGLILGKDNVIWVAWMGDVFIRLLKMLIVPLVFSSIVVGVASIGDPAKLGRVGLKTILYYLLTTAFAVTIGLILGNLMKVGAGMQIGEGLQFTGKEAPSLYQVFLNIFPKNPVAAMANGAMLQIIVFALFFGIAALMAGQKGKLVLDVMDSVAETMYKLTAIVMWWAPFGVFGLIAKVVGTKGLAILLPYTKVILGVYIGVILHALITYTGVLSLLARLNPWVFFKKAFEATFTAFVTRSSSATLPVTMRVAKEKLGVSESIASFVLPLGATINMDGTALYQGVAALFIAQVYGMHLTLSQQIMVVVTATLASIGTAGVPGAGLIMLTLVTQSIGLPIEGVALIAGIDVFLDMARTALNVTGDLTGATFVAKSEGELDENVYYAE